MVVKYDLLLLDADGTLLDFEKAQEHAFFDMAVQIGFLADHQTLSLYDRINDAYWKKLESGEVSKRDLVVLRFRDLFQQLRISADPGLANDIYTANLAESSDLIEGALETCAELAGHCTLAIATNGQKATQFRRIEKSEIAPYIQKVFVSEQVGAAKPDPRFFAYALEQCGVSDKSKVLMVGDSLVADIKGALAFGLDACWVNRKNQQAPEHLAITATVKQVRDIIPLVLK